MRVLLLVCVLLTATLLSAGLVVSVFVFVLLTTTMLSAGLVVSMCVLLTVTMLSTGLVVVYMCVANSNHAYYRSCY